MKKEKHLVRILFWGELFGFFTILLLGCPPLFYSAPLWRAETRLEDEKTVQEIIRENSSMLENEILKENELSKSQLKEAKPEEKKESNGGEENREAEASVQNQTVAVDSQTILENYFVVDPDTSLTSDTFDAGELLQRDMRIKGDNSRPQILIYHTHSQEGFADSVDGDTETTVVGVGECLTEILREQYGYQVLHVTQSFDLVNGNLDRNQAYANARPVIQAVLEEYPSIEIVIDLHRDGVREERHLVKELNGKPTAQVMFFNGLSYTNEKGTLEGLANPYIWDNISFSLQLKMQAEALYPGWQRCIYVKGYRYNLHFRPRCLLLEVGAQTNTVEEEKNAMEPFADILNRVLTQR